MIMRETVERQTHFPQIVDALDLLRPHLAAIKHRQQHRRQNHDDRNDHQQLDQGESSPDAAVRAQRSPQGFGVRQPYAAFKFAD